MPINKKAVIIVILILAAVLLSVYFFWLAPSPTELESDTGPVKPTVAVPPMPDTLQEAVAVLGDPEVLAAFLNEYFIIERRPGLVSYTPEEFYERQKGDAHDFAVFAAHVLWRNRIEAGILRFNYRINGRQDTHLVTVFSGEQGSKYISVTNEGVKIFHPGLPFADLIAAEEKRLNAEIYEYTYFPAEFGINDLREPALHRNWVEVK